MPKYKEYTGETRNFSKSAGYKRRRRRKKLQKKVTSLVLSAALFGAVAGGRNLLWDKLWAGDCKKQQYTDRAKPEYGFPGSADGFHSKRSGRRSSQCFRHCSRGTSFRSLCYEYIGAGGGKLFWAF